MLLIGKLLKETIKQGQNRRRKLSVTHSIKVKEQEATLHEIMKDAQNCELFRHFDLTLKSPKTINEELRSKVPLFKYESFYQQWL